MTVGNLFCANFITNMNKILSFVFLFSCCVLASQGQKAVEPLKLDYFRKIPPTHEGCFGMYTYDSLSLNKGNIIIVSDLQDSLFVTIGRRKIPMFLENTI